jgi:hypothetical protein
MARRVVGNSASAPSSDAAAPATAGGIPGSGDNWSDFVVRVAPTVRLAMSEAVSSSTLGQTIREAPHPRRARRPAGLAQESRKQQRQRPCLAPSEWLVLTARDAFVIGGAGRHWQERRCLARSHKRHAKHRGPPPEHWSCWWAHRDPPW